MTKSVPIIAAIVLAKVDLEAGKKNSGSIAANPKASHFVTAPTRVVTSRL